MNFNGLTLKNIKYTAKKSLARAEVKPLIILRDNLVLMRDYQEGCNKLQDNYKSKPFVVIPLHDVHVIQSIIKTVLSVG